MQLLEYDHALKLVVLLNCYHEAISLKALMKRLLFKCQGFILGRLVWEENSLISKNLNATHSCKVSGRKTYTFHFWRILCLLTLKSENPCDIQVEKLKCTKRVEIWSAVHRCCLCPSRISTLERLISVRDDAIN